MKSKVLMSLIGSGDLLIGIYLTILSVYDSLIFSESYCQHQPEWLTGTPCLVLGVISTMGSQVSLFSMTVLGFIRMRGLTSEEIAMPEAADKKTALKAAIMALFILVASLFIAVVPLLPYLEDYFVQGIYYDPTYKVMIGFPNKDRHIDILKAYYDRGNETESTIKPGLSWSEIAIKIDRMFTQDYGILSRYPVHFYGNDGVCLYKYFVRTDDARRSRGSFKIEADTTHEKGDVAVWTMLVLNLICFIIITVCYIRIILYTKKISKRSGQHDNLERQKQNRAVQNRITIIIITDFLCWVPFIIISGLHNVRYIDASDWYATFAMIVLPLNSVINPLIYDRSLLNFFVKGHGYIKERLRQIDLSVWTILTDSVRRNDEPDIAAPVEIVD